MATVAEVKHKAGRLCGVVAMGQALSATNDALLQEAYGQEYEILKDEGLAVWASTGTVPAKVAGHLAALIAFNACDDLAVSGERYNRILARRNAAPAAIRKLLSPAHVTLENPVDY